MQRKGGGWCSQRAAGMHASTWRGGVQAVVDGGVGGRASAPGVNGLTERARVTEEIKVDMAMVAVTVGAACATENVKTSLSSRWQRRAIAGRGDAARVAPGMGQRRKE